MSEFFAHDNEGGRLTGWPGAIGYNLANPIMYIEDPFVRLPLQLVQNYGTTDDPHSRHL